MWLDISDNPFHTMNSHESQKLSAEEEEAAILTVSNPPISVVSSPVEDSPVHTEYASTSSQFSCTKFVVKRLPILGWLPKYKPREDLLPDAISGVTVGLTAIPQSIAYANVAGLTPEVSQFLMHEIKM